MAKKVHRLPKAPKRLKAEKGAKPAVRARKPRSQTLPGMEQVRNARLDHLCQDIGDARDKMNTARSDELGATQAALALMHDENRNVYKHAGVELARVPGTERLRVRLVKDQGDADVSGAETSAQNADEGEE